MITLAFEGIDGSGKTTLIDKVAEKYKDTLNVFILKEPSSLTPANKQILNFLINNKELTEKRPEFALHLFTASRVLDLQYIKEHPEIDLLLLDRFIGSTIVYQVYLAYYEIPGAEFKKKIKFTETLSSMIMQDFKVDATFLVNTRPAEAIKRISNPDRKGNNTLFETPEYLQKLYNCYNAWFHDYARLNPKLYGDTEILDNNNEDQQAHSMNKIIDYLDNPVATIKSVKESKAKQLTIFDLLVGEDKEA